MLHGYNLYANFYTHIAEFYVENGYDVVGIDYLGFGNSDGTRVLISDPLMIVEITEVFVKKLKIYYKN